METGAGGRLPLVRAAIPHLLNFDKYGDFPAALRGAALANDFQVVLFSESYHPVLRVETRHRVTVEDAVRAAKKTALREDSLYTRIDIHGIVTYWGSVTLQGERFFLVLVDNEEAYTIEEISDLAAILVVAMEMWQYAPAADASLAYLRALRRGNADAALLWQDQVTPGAKPEAVFFVTGQEGTSIRDFLTEAEGDLPMRWEVEEATGYGVLLHKGSLSDLAARLPETGDLQLLGLGGLTGVEEASRAFRWISEASEAVGIVFPSRRVLTRYELLLTHTCLELKRRGGAVYREYRDLLAPLRRPGDSKREALLRTLCVALLDTDTNAPAAAGHLGVHTNTVLYRLRRAGELLGVEIAPGKTPPALVVAMALERLEKAPGSVDFS